MKLSALFLRAAFAGVAATACYIPQLHAEQIPPAVGGAKEVRGQQVYEHWCVACHGYGAARPGTDSMRRHGFDPPHLTERSDITPELTRLAVRNGMLFMPWFRKTEISDAALEDLAAYLATAHLNDKKGGNAKP